MTSPIVQHPHVLVEPDVLSGSPYIEGSRVPVRRLWAWHRDGTSIEMLLRRYPQLGPARVLDALAFAYDNQELIETDLANERLLLSQSTQPIPPGLRPMKQESLPMMEVTERESRGRRR